MKKIIKKEVDFCPFCWEDHELVLIEDEITMTFLNETITYQERVWLCEETDGTFIDAELSELNHQRKLTAYEDVRQDKEARHV